MPEDKSEVLQGTLDLMVLPRQTCGNQLIRRSIVGRCGMGFQRTGWSIVLPGKQVA